MCSEVTVNAVNIYVINYVDGYNAVSIHILVFLIDFKYACGR